MLKIGLTGGIGSGKSTIARLFNQTYDIPVIDADIIAHQLVEPGQPALELLVDSFGKQIIDTNGVLNRKTLRDMVFTDPSKKKKLENLLHPLIYQKMQSEFDQQNSAYCLLCIPLLIETKQVAFVDRVLVIDCSVETQIERVKQRDKLTTDCILSIISTQAPREQRLKIANDIIDNSNSNTQLAEQVKKLHNQYLLLSNS